MNESDIPTQHNHSQSNEARLRRDLERATNDIKVTTPQPPQWTEHGDSPRRSPVRWWFAAAAILVVVIGAGIWIAGDDSGDLIIADESPADDVNNTNETDDDSDSADLSADQATEVTHNPIFHPEAGAVGGIWRLPREEPLDDWIGDSPFTVMGVTASEKSSAGLIWVDDMTTPSVWIGAFPLSGISLDRATLEERQLGEDMALNSSVGGDVRTYKLSLPSASNSFAPDEAQPRWLVSISDDEDARGMGVIVAYAGSSDTVAAQIAVVLRDFEEDFHSYPEDPVALARIDHVVMKNTNDQAALMLAEQPESDQSLQIATTHGTVEIDPFAKSRAVTLLSLRVRMTLTELMVSTAHAGALPYVSQLGPDGVVVVMNRMDDAQMMPMLVTEDGVVMSVRSGSSEWMTSDGQSGSSTDHPRSVADQIALINRFRPVPENDFRAHLSDNHIAFNE